MGKRPAKVSNISIGGVALEGYAANISLDATQELPNVTAISDLGPRVVVGNYDYKVGVDGNNDFASGALDATVWGSIGSTAVHALDFQPTGTTETADDPSYNATDVCLASYSIKAAVGGAVTFTAQYQGNSSMARNTT